ncbi:hypothetical protein RhiJN_02347 [Ceratobasidium sp. AG-Ba]|nr:hypothetical protein RhiJN_02347 [Ceratobasidium sp. AG-Ba]
MMIPIKTESLASDNTTPSPVDHQSSATQAGGVEISQLLGNLSLSGVEQTTDESNIPNKDSNPVKGIIRGPRSKSGAPPQDETCSGTLDFVVANIYGYDILTHLIYQMDDQDSAALLELTKNPPLPFHTFTINNELFQMDWDMTLFRSVDGLWLKETLYESFADAFNIQKAITRERDANPLDRSMLGLGSNLVEPATLAEPATLVEPTTLPSLQPHWLRLGSVPSQNDVDAFIEATKSERKQADPGDRPLLYCPLPDCSHPRELRRPQALRDHLYFHYSIKRTNRAASSTPEQANNVNKRLS